jgi:hypothetical protein
MSKLFVILVLIFSSGIIGFSYLDPAWKEFQSLRQNSESLANISAELDGLTENRDELVSSINTVSKENLERINQALPEGQHAAEFLVLLETLSKKHNMVLRRVDLAGAEEAQNTETRGLPKPGVGIVKSSPTGSVEDFPFALDLGGTYESFKALLIDLEHNLRIIDVISVSFVSPGKPDQFSFSVKGKTYYQQ